MDNRTTEEVKKDGTINIEEYKKSHGGHTPQEVQEMIDFQNKRRKKIKEQREIISSTYKRTQNRMTKNVNSWFGRGMEKY